MAGLSEFFNRLRAGPETGFRRLPRPRRKPTRIPAPAAFGGVGLNRFLSEGYGPEWAGVPAWNKAAISEAAKNVLLNRGRKFGEDIPLTGEFEATKDKLEPIPLSNPIVTGYDKYAAGAPPGSKAKPIDKGTGKKDKSGKSAGGGVLDLLESLGTTDGKLSDDDKALIGVVGGLTMAASQNPSFLGAAAEGGIGAVSQYMAERKVMRDSFKNKAQAIGLMAQAQRDVAEASAVGSTPEIKNMKRLLQMADKGLIPWSKQEVMSRVFPDANFSKFLASIDPFATDAEFQAKVEQYKKAYGDIGSGGVRINDPNAPGGGYNLRSIAR